MKLHITVDGQVFEVEVEVAEEEPFTRTYGPPQTSRMVALPTTAPPAAAGQEAVADESKVCRSPVAGTVVSVEVEVGQEIGVDDTLIVLEAMKMETVVTAPLEGIVAAVNASAGDAVQSGQVLVEFE